MIDLTINKQGLEHNLKKAKENNSVDVSETAEWLDDEEELARICGIR